MCLFGHICLVLGRFHHTRVRLPVSSALCYSQSSIAHSFAHYVLWQGMSFNIGLSEFMLSTFLSSDLSDCLCLCRLWFNQKISWHLCNWKIACGNSCREVSSLCESFSFATLLAHMGFCCLHSRSADVNSKTLGTVFFPPEPSCWSPRTFQHRAALLGPLSQAHVHWLRLMLEMMIWHSELT